MRYYHWMVIAVLVLAVISGCRELTYEDIVEDIPEVPQEAACTDDCPAESRECHNRTFLALCGQFDEDSCLDFKTAPCMVGAYCKQGECIFKTWEEQQCENECTENQCHDGTSLELCGQFDDDPCLDIKIIPCREGTYCDDGECIPIEGEYPIDQYIHIPQPFQDITPYLPSPLPSADEMDYISPGDYAQIVNLQPFKGNPNSILKVLFVKVGNPPYYDEMVDSIINSQLKAIEPFKGKPIAYYKTSVSESSLDCKPVSGSGLGGSGFSCNNYELYKKILQKVTVDDIRGIITIAIVESEYGGSGGDIIYVGVDPNRDMQVNLDLSNTIAIHEIGHNFGLGDLYYGIFYFDGSPSQFYDTEASRQFLNVDGPGCPKWCDSYKPVSQYTESVSAPCLQFTNRNDCVAFGREEDGKSCEYDGNYPKCCVWSDEPFEYFNSRCVPGWGTEDIGIGCYGDSGCYFGAMYGNYAWRPVFGDKEMMFSAMEDFSDVSRRELDKVFDCCLSTHDSSSRCESFREDYSDFLKTYNFKKRIGSCGYSVS